MQRKLRKGLMFSFALLLILLCLWYMLSHHSLSRLCTLVCKQLDSQRFLAFSTKRVRRESTQIQTETSFFLRSPNRHDPFFFSVFLYLPKGFLAMESSFTLDKESSGPFM